MLLLAKLALGATAAGLVAAGALSSEGFVDVKVEEHAGGEHHHLHVIAPAIVAPLAVWLVPADKWGDASCQIRPWLPSIDAAVRALEESPDATLIEVSSPDAYVLVEKSGGSLIVDVAHAEQTVHVSVPLRAIGSTSQALAAKM